MIKRSLTLVLLGLLAICAPLYSMVDEKKNDLADYFTQLHRKQAYEQLSNVYKYMIDKNKDQKTKQDNLTGYLHKMVTPGGLTALYLLGDTAFINTMLNSSEGIATADALNLAKMILDADLTSNNNQQFYSEKLKNKKNVASALEYATNGLNKYNENKDMFQKKYLNQLIQLYQKHEENIGSKQGVTNLTSKFSSAKSRIFVYALIFGGVSLGGWALWKFFR